MSKYIFNYSLYKKYADKYSSTNDKTDLTYLRNYLDSCGVYMPKPRYVYTEHDISTHKFVDGRIFRDKNSRRIYIDQYNDKYAY